MSDFSNQIQKEKEATIKPNIKSYGKSILIQIEDKSVKAQSQSDMMEIETYNLQRVRSIIKNIMLEDETKNEKFIISQVQMHVNEDYLINFNEILDSLCRMSFELFESMIYFWDWRNKIYVHINQELKLYLHVNVLNEVDTLMIKFKKIDNEVEIEDCEEIKVDNDDQKSQQAIIQSKINQEKQKRVKERSIQFALQIVDEWRKIHEDGIEDGNKKIKVNLDQAAQILGMSRKTLNEYALQIRKAKERGFEFDANLNQKIGVLRKFNKIKDNQEQTRGVNDNPYINKILTDVANSVPTQQEEEYDHIENQHLEIQLLEFNNKNGKQVKNYVNQEYIFQQKYFSSDEDKIKFENKSDSDDQFFTKKKQDDSFDLFRND